MILNMNYLYQVSNTKNFRYEFAQKRVLNENDQQFRNDSADKYDIFLSHSYMDKELVCAVVDLFNSAGYSIYIDWMNDQQLNRSEVTATTADILRKRMRSLRVQRMLLRAIQVIRSGVRGNLDMPMQRKMVDVQFYLL